MNLSERESCFRELIERNHARWAGVARCYALPGDRDDLLQEILMQLWRSMPRFQGRSAIDTWAYRVALNTALAWNRKARTRATRLQTRSMDVGHIAGHAESDSREMRVLDEFLAALSKTDRAVMLLYLDDVPNPQAAEITGLSEGALRVRLHRLRKRFEEAYCGREVTHDV